MSRRRSALHNLRAILARAKNYRKSSPSQRERAADAADFAARLDQLALIVGVEKFARA
jgi:hypothetical protein